MHRAHFGVWLGWVAAAVAVCSGPITLADNPQEPTEVELDHARAGLIASVPKPGADYLFGAESVRPAWTGMAGLAIRRDYFGPGSDGIQLDPGPEPGRAGFWRLDEIEPGEYYVGLWLESGNARHRTEYWPPPLLTTAFLNGWPLRFATTTEPIQVKPGLWLLELQTAGAVKLNRGDELAFTTPPSWWSKPVTVLRLALYRREPPRGHGVTGQTFGTDFWIVQRLRLVPELRIEGSGADGTEHVAQIAIHNPLPYPADAELSWRLADYYGSPITARTERVHIEPHASYVTRWPFTPVGDARAYQLDARTQPAAGFRPPYPRPTEWLALNDYARWEFLPHQPSPLTTWNHVRRELADDRTGSRKRLCLDGNDWEWAYLDGRHAPDDVPTNLTFAPATVPFTEYWIKLPPDRFGKWFRKRFVAPQWLTSERYLLEISAVESEATIFLNGRRVGCGIGSLPVFTDVTDALQPGATNELLICVRGKISVVKPEYVAHYDPENWRELHENEDVYVNAHVTPCLKSVFLQAVPAVRVRHSLVLADPERQTLRIMTQLENSSAERQDVTLRFAILEGGRPVPSRGHPRADGLQPDGLGVWRTTQPRTIAPGEVQELSFEIPAGSLTPWTPRRPALAQLITTVMSAQRELDRFERRFGYRSVRVAGTRLLLNGRPVRFFGICNGFRPHNLYEMENGAEFVRGDGEEYRELYDEIGVPHLAVVWTCSAQNWPRLNNDRYWDSWLRHIKGAVWEQGSRPAVVGWQMSCEAYHYTIYTAGKEGQEKHGDRIYAGVRTIRDNFWPQAWCVADGDETLGDRLDFCSFHYLNHGHAMRGFGHNPEGGSGLFDGVAAWPPDSFFLNGASRVPKPGTVLRMNPDWIYGSTACGSTEDFEFWGLDNGVAVSKFIGDRAAVSAACQFHDPRGMAWTKTAIEGYRDMEMSVVGCVYWQSFLGLAEQDVAFAMPEQEIRYYAGTRLDRRLNLHDDEYLPGRLAFRWHLLAPDGKTVDGGRVTATSDTAFLKRARLTFRVPRVTQRTPYTLRMELWKNGRKRAAEERLLEVWPPLPTASAASAYTGAVFALYDPNGQLAPLLARLGVRSVSLTNLSDLCSASPSNAPLMIAPNAAITNAAEVRACLGAWVTAGGRVLVLQQEDISFLPADVTLEKRAWFSQAFVRVPHHPVLAGLRDQDFHMWNPGHVVAKGAYRKPEKGAFLTLVDAGHDGTMAWAPLLELYLGQGSLLLCQLRLTENCDTEPMCAELLRRLLTYLQQPVFRYPQETLAVLEGAGEPVLARLREVRSVHVIVPEPQQQYPVTLVDLTARSQLPDSAVLRAYAEQGGVVWIHRVRPDHAAWLSALAGREVRLEVQPYQAWVDRQILERRDGLVTGLNNLDLYWRSLIIGEGPEHKWQVSCGVEPGRERGQVHYLAKVAGVADYLFPGGLLEVRTGTGRLIIDQLKWEVSSKDMICGSPARVLSALLTNLGLARHPPQPKPALPHGVIHQPVDIAPVANRGFRDEKAGDGVGWLDWGANADLRSFPTGLVTLAGIPYLIPGGERNAILLRTAPDYVASLADYPETVVIPINRSGIAGFWFLHTGGWAWGEQSFGRREVHYADGTVAVMHLNGSNMHDWNPGQDDFPDEERTLTTVAWKGTTPQYPVIRVYHTLWLNPHPDKTVRQVVLSNAGLEPKQRRVVAHLGLTLARLPPEQAIAEGQRDPERSRSLLQEALQLLASGQKSAASAKLSAALEADAGNAGAWTALARIRAETDSVEAFTAFCRQWLKAMPENYQAHNALGKFLENRGRYAEALEEYRKSLAIEWNQPPIGQAVQRLEKMLP